MFKLLTNVLSLYIIFFTLFYILFYTFFSYQRRNFQPLVSPVSAQENFAGKNISDNLLEIPLLTQERNLSCEASSIKMVLAYFGIDIPEDEIQNSFPLNNNPHKGYRGNVDGPIWGFEDYGVYAEVVAKTLNKFGIRAISYRNISAEDLKIKILGGKPAIIWVNIANPNPKLKEVVINGETVKLISGEHTVVVAGYQDGNWILNDPWRRTTKDGTRLSEQLRVDDLNHVMWEDFDNMAVLIN